MTETKYYFVSFVYGASEKKFYNGLLNIHPLEWQADANDSYPDQYVLMHWQEISREEFDTFYRNGVWL